jgi:hypothetical protein
MSGDVPFFKQKKKKKLGVKAQSSIQKELPFLSFYFGI